MRYPATRRARKLAGADNSRLVALLGIGAALLVPLLVLDLALIVQLIVSRGSHEVPADWVLGPWVNSKLVEWPLFDNHEFTLVVLVVAGALIAIVECAAMVFLQKAVQRQASRVSSQLREAVHRQTFLLGPHDLLGAARSRPEELFVDATNAVRRGLAVRWHVLPRALVTLICFTVLSLAVNFWFTLLAGMLALCTVRWYDHMQQRANEQEEQWRGESNSLQAGLLRTLRLARLRVGYDLDEPASDTFAKELQPLEHAEFKLDTARALIGPLFFLSSLLAAAFLLFVVGLGDAVRGVTGQPQQFTISGTIFIAAAFACAFFSARQLHDLRFTLATTERAAAEVFAFLDRTPTVHQSDDAERLDRLGQKISLEGVTLANREGRRLLDEVSLDLPAGKLLAVLASDSQTPLALGGLLVRFYDPSGGRVLFDGHDIRQAVLDTVRGQALLVPHEGLVFPGSVATNVMCGQNGFTALQVSDALKRARVFDFAQQLPDREATELCAFDERLTPAHAFRLGLARALVREPSLIVVDEPGGEWPDEIAREHNEAIREAKRNATVVIAPAQIETLRTVDTVYLFHQGKLHDQGTHAELLQRSELYRHIIYVRFNEFRGEVE